MMSTTGKAVALLTLLALALVLLAFNLWLGVLALCAMVPLGYTVARA